MAQRRERGISLLEMLLCLALLAILASLSAPGLGTWLRDEASASAARDFTAAIQLARYSAMTRRRIVTLCRSAEGRSCRGDWESGVLVFVDDDGDAELDTDDEILRHVVPPSGPTIRWRAFQNRAYLQMTPQGLTRWQNGNFTFCPGDGAAAGARQLVVTATGRVRAAVDSDGDGIREDAQGKPLDCDWVTTR